MFAVGTACLCSLPGPLLLEQFGTPFGDPQIFISRAIKNHCAKVIENFVDLSEVYAPLSLYFFLFFVLCD